MTDSERDPQLEADGDYAQFEVHAQAEIVHILHHAIERRALVSVYREGGANLALTTLLEADAARDELVFDVPQREEHTARLVGAAHLTFVTSESGIKLKFQVEGAAVRMYRGHPALVSHLPRTMLRLQRREYFRIATPLTDPPLVTLLSANAGDAPGVGLPVLNVSLGGVALMDQHPTLNLAAGQRYVGCQIKLPHVGTFRTGLEVRSCQEIALRNGMKARRAGCLLIAPEPAAAGLLQRYIMGLERARNPRFTKN